MGVTAESVVEAVLAGRPLEPVGGGSVVGRLGPAGRPATDGLALDGLAGVLAYDPADLTITVGAGTTMAELDAVLAAAGQECPIEGLGSTVGGRVATGLSGLRRLGAGPLRDWVLGARFVTGDGRVARAGGVTVKNVTGYDLPRLLCGSWGTLGVLVEVTLKTRPRPRASGWYATTAPLDRSRLYRPAAIVRTPGRTSVLLEGHPGDLDEQARGAGLTPADAPQLPTGIRLSVPPGAIDGFLPRLPGRWAAEEGVGVVHADRAGDLAALRADAEAVGGRLLVLDPPDGFPALGRPANPSLVARVKAALDPAGILAPWRYAT